MHSFTGFTADDFDVFAIPGLDPRMEALRAGPSLKLAALGRQLAPQLTDVTGETMHPIVARHMRRKVNPPKDTWVAWSASKRGYKMLPHFQVGLWETHAFIQAGVIYEAQGRAAFGQCILDSLTELRKALPPHFRWLQDCRDPLGIAHGDMTDADFEVMAERLRTRKEADSMVGLSVNREEVVQAGPAFAEMALGVMEVLRPIYRMARFSLTH